MQRKVVVDLWGGVGNQLHRFAAGLSVARRLGASEVLAGQGSSGLDLFEALTGMRLRRATWVDETISGGIAVSTTPLTYNIGSALSKLVFTRAVVQSGHAWAPMPNPRSIAGYSHVKGPCEHPTYYVGSIDRVLQGIHAHAGDALRRFATNLPSLVINLRRGDFVTLKWALAADYYLRAISHLQSLNFPNPKTAMIVGDDSLACLGLSRLLQNHFGDIAFSIEARTDPLAHFAIIAKADYLIMSNSTFCWWARKYGESTGSTSVTIYPQSEIRRGNPNADDSWQFV